MKKVININFQGRIIPIEETAYELLKQYIDSLRRYFADEEGRDEIINDIESRIAELFSEKLNAGAHCIIDDDVTAVTGTIGRPEDFDQDNGQEHKKDQERTSSRADNSRGKFYRNADDKILGGVCSGLASYLKTDPVLIRIISVFLIGPLFWLYILVWLIVPSRSLQTNITRRFYRKPEGKVFGGVCGGLAVYFDTEVWIPRLVFALPLISALLSGTWGSIFGTWDLSDGWHLLTGSLGSSLVLVYVILWIAVPTARSASDLLEMKGEKIDLNSIRNTVKDNLGQIQSKAENFKTEFKESATRLSSNNESGFAQFIRFVFKAIVFFFAGILALTLLAVFIGLAFGGMAVFPLKDLLLQGTAQNTLAWCSLILVIGVPVIAIITWLIRNIAGARSHKNYLPAVFTVLWVGGLVCMSFLFASVYQNFKVKHSDAVQVQIQQPSGEALIITALQESPLQRYTHRFWNDLDEDDNWLAGVYRDSFLLKNVKVHIDKSPDSLYHVYAVKYSRGASIAAAQQLIGHIGFNISQNGDQLLLPAGVMIPKTDRFHNQQVMVVVEVPEGRNVRFDKSLDHYSWVVFRNNGSNFSINTDDDGDHHHYNTLYTMTSNGLHSEHGDDTGDDAGNERTLEPFSSVVLDLPSKVILHPSDRNYLVIHGPEAIEQDIRTKVRHGKLRITGDDDFHSNDEILIDVYSDRYSDIVLNGSGTIVSPESITLSDNLSVTINGSGNVTLKGTCKHQELVLTGSGNIDLADVIATRTNVLLTGSGAITTNTQEQIKGTLSGSGNIINNGKAAQQVSVTGSGKFVQH